VALIVLLFPQLAAFDLERVEGQFAPSAA
jgi:hypothetical protein